MLRQIDQFLNQLTMYKVVLYGLLTIFGCTCILSVTGDLPYGVLPIIFSTLILTTVCYLGNSAMSKWFNAPVNVESSAITALILFFLFPPVSQLSDAITLFTVSVAAMASKYIFAFKKKHLFNPVAVGAVVTAAIGAGGATWWVATPVLLPATVLIGLLVVRKIRRFSLFISYLLAATFSIIIMNVQQSDSITQLLTEMIISWPIIFMGTIMVTEPLTTPPTRQLQIQYGIIVGLLLGIKYSFGPFYSSPETALVLGNVFSYLVSPKQKLFLHLDNKRKLAETVYEFVFRTDTPLKFQAGQYLEWLLPHEHPDIRGNRRYFTIASSPTEPEIKLGIKVPASSSSFKQHLTQLEKGGLMVAAQLAGDFVLPQDSKEKLVFIAGGIGVTPFRSMIKFLLDTKQRRDIILLYCSSTADEFVYQDIFADAKKIGLKTYYIITHAEAAPKNWTGLTGRLSASSIANLVPDYKQRMFYLSGPNAMVHSYAEILAELQVAKTKIKQDYFPGF